MTRTFDERVAYVKSRVRRPSNQPGLNGTFAERLAHQKKRMAKSIALTFEQRVALAKIKREIEHDRRKRNTPTHASVEAQNAIRRASPRPYKPPIVRGTTPHESDWPLSLTRRQRGLEDSVSDYIGLDELFRKQP